MQHMGMWKGFPETIEYTCSTWECGGASRKVQTTSYIRCGKDCTVTWLNQVDREMERIGFYIKTYILCLINS